MRRRAFLVACGAAGLAGCPSTDPTETQDAGGDTTPARPTDTVSARPTDTVSARPTDTASARPTDTTREGGETRETSNGASATATPRLFPGYETTEVRVTTPDGDLLGSVLAAVADTPELRFTGLSDTEHLPADRGMLFVYDSPGEHTYVMRRMDFGIDIVYADAEGAITRIHHAPEPGPDEDGEDQKYPGRGQYVLELAYRWTEERGVEPGDLLRFDR